jgi:hypothetical protein
VGDKLRDLAREVVDLDAKADAIKARRRAIAQELAAMPEALDLLRALAGAPAEAPAPTAPTARVAPAPAAQAPADRPPHLAAADRARVPIKSEILARLRGGSCQRRDILEGVALANDTTEATVATALQQLIREGKALRLSAGLYGLATRAP